MDLCILHIDQHEIGIPMNAVREVLIRPGINPLPLSPDFLTGITSFRGMALPVIELTPLLNLSSGTPSNHKSAGSSRDRVVVCQNDQRVFGIRVDLLNNRTIPESLSDGMQSHHLLTELEISEELPLNILSLTTLLKQAKELMKPHMEHLS